MARVEIPWELYRVLGTSRIIGHSSVGLSEPLRSEAKPPRCKEDPVACLVSYEPPTT